MKIVPIVSGGMDSITMLYDLIQNGNIIETIVSFNYGQRHKKELEYAHRHAASLGIQHDVIDLHAAGLATILAQSGSSLTNPNEDVPEGHYAASNMAATVVPNRNMMMLAIAGSIAVATEADAVATAVHAGDHFIYPDCREDFIEAMDDAMELANEGFGSPEGTGVWAPYVNLSKAQIAGIAIDLGVPFEETWSCYKGGDMHCGKCGTCVERLEAIAAASKGRNVTDYDKTLYADNTYWRTVLEASN
jgi:7-cyano-7-deazaguanine synthase